MSAAFELLGAQGASFLRVRCWSCRATQVVAKSAWRDGALSCVCARQRRLLFRAAKLQRGLLRSSALDLPWLDRRTRYVLQRFPEGLERAELAVLLDLEEREVAQLEEQAMAKLRVVIT